MNRITVLASLIVLGTGTATLLRSNQVSRSAITNQTVVLTTDAAFRDGLYLGRLAAKRGAEPHVATGRWATSADRASFSSGYQQGYIEFLASRAAPTTSMRRE